jgi:hypothetical protein
VNGCGSRALQCWRLHPRADGAGSTSVMVDHALPSSRNVRSRQLANPADRISLPPQQRDYAVESDASYTAPAAHHHFRPPRSCDSVDCPSEPYRSVPLGRRMSLARVRANLGIRIPTPGCRAATTLLLRPREPCAAFCAVSNSNLLRIRQHDLLYFSSRPSLFNQQHTEQPGVSLDFSGFFSEPPTVSLSAKQCKQPIIC